MIKTIYVHNYSCSTSKQNIPEDSHWTLPSTFSQFPVLQKILGKRDLPKYFQSAFCDLREQSGAQFNSGFFVCVSALIGMYFKNESEGYHISKQKSIRNTMKYFVAQLKYDCCSSS